MTARLKDKYQKEVVPSLMKEFKYKNVMQVPRLEKIVLNIGLGEAVKEIKPRLFIPVHYTPSGEADPIITPDMFFSKDPAFFTRKEDPSKMRSLLEGSGVEVAVLRKLGLKNL